jgi:hypothetical protein
VCAVSIQLKVAHTVCSRVLQSDYRSNPAGRTYKNSRGSQCQGLEHVSATADATIEEHWDTAICFSDNLNFPSQSESRRRKTKWWECACKWSPQDKAYLF